MGADERARVWLWCAYLMGVEATPLEYIYPRPQGDEAERIYAQLDALDAAGERFSAKAAEVAGRPMTNDDWRCAIDKLGQVDGVALDAYRDTC